MSRSVVVVMVLGLLLGGPAVAGAQTFTLYDPFNPGPIDPALWRGFEQNTHSQVIRNTDAARIIVGGFLQTVLTSAHLGTPGNDTGSAGAGRLGLQIARQDLLDDEPAITGLSTNVKVMSAGTQNCLTNTTATRTRAQVFGLFFNDGTSTGPTDRTGDVLAGINLERNSKVGDHIVAFLDRCPDAACTFSSNLKFVVFTQTWHQGGPVPVSVFWDRINNMFVFTVGKGKSREIHTLTYGDLGLSDAKPAVAFFHTLRVGNSLPNCSTPVRASMTALFDFLSISTEAGVFP